MRARAYFLGLSVVTVTTCLLFWPRGDEPRRAAGPPQGAETLGTPRVTRAGAEPIGDSTWRLEVRVVDDTRRPVPASVQVRDDRGSATLRFEPGKPCIAVVAGVVRVVALALDDGLAPGQVDDITSVAGGERTLEVRLLPGRRIVGRLVDTDRQPIMGADVAQMRVEARLVGAAAPVSTAVIEGDGEFRTRAMSNGLYSVRAIGGEGRYEDSAEVLVTTGTSHVELVCRKYLSRFQLVFRETKTEAMLPIGTVVQWTASWHDGAQTHGTSGSLGPDQA